MEIISTGEVLPPLAEDAVRDLTILWDFDTIVSLDKLETDSDLWPDHHVDMLIKCPKAESYPMCTPNAGRFLVSVSTICSISWNIR